MKIIQRIALAIVITLSLSFDANAQLGASKSSIINVIGKENVKTGTNRNGDEYIYYDREKFRNYCVLDSEDICIKYVRFPESHPVRVERKNNLDLMSKATSDYKKIDDNEWLTYDNKGKVKITLTRFLRKTAFVYTRHSEE